MAYVSWVGKRLPTEEEWEFAARGTDNFIYPWGNEWKSECANANNIKKTFTEVGKFDCASPFGIYDMVGNAWEWTSSDYKPYPNGKRSKKCIKKNLKVSRGGSFMAEKDKRAITTVRLCMEETEADIGYTETGFRCVKDIKK